MPKGDLISRADFVEQLMRVIIGSPMDPNCAEVALVALRECRTVDAVEVVRCKDCKWRNTVGCPYMNFNAVAREDYDFCSDGERREDDA